MPLLILEEGHRHETGGDVNPLRRLVLVVAALGVAAQATAALLVGSAGSVVSPTDLVASVPYPVLLLGLLLLTVAGALLPWIGAGLLLLLPLLLVLRLLRRRSRPAPTAGQSPEATG